MPGCQRIHQPLQIARDGPRAFAGPLPILPNASLYFRRQPLAPTSKISQFFVAPQQSLDLFDFLEQGLFRPYRPRQPFGLIPNGLQRKPQSMKTFATRIVRGRLDEPIETALMRMTQDIKVGGEGMGGEAIAGSACFRTTCSILL